MNKINCNAEIHFKDFPVGTIFSLMEIILLKLTTKLFLMESHL